jgi:hypothetical protein
VESCYILERDILRESWNPTAQTIRTYPYPAYRGLHISFLTSNVSSSLWATKEQWPPLHFTRKKPSTPLFLNLILLTLHIHLIFLNPRILLRPPIRPIRRRRSTNTVRVKGRINLESHRCRFDHAPFRRHPRRHRHP